MPNINTYSTEDLLNFADGTSLSPFTTAEIIAELKDRKITEQDDPDDLGYRGGTRPTSQPINP